MKATIEFPSWIDESEFEFVGWGFIPTNSNEYGILKPDSNSWFYENYFDEHTSADHKVFRFRKKKKFVWPECFKDGTKMWFEPQGNAWQK
jgi:hypothetical protein